MEKETERKILALIDEAEFSSDIRDYKEVLKYLTSIKERYVDDAKFQYYYGYILLSFPDDEIFYRKMALQALQKSLDIDPKNKNAYFHLINCKYFFGNYANALDGYIKILDYLRLEKNEAASISVLERILSCFLKLNRNGKFLNNYSLWIRAYRSTHNEEEFIIPKELINSVSEFLIDKGDRMSEDHQRAFKNVCIDLLKIIEAFPKSKKHYKEQIEALKNWDGKYSGPYILELV